MALTLERKRNMKLDFHLVFDYLKIQSCRLTCSFPNDLNCAEFNGVTQGSSIGPFIFIIYTIAEFQALSGFLAFMPMTLL